MPMERIHKKSALPETSDLLHAAHDLGAELAWERYEQQLPLCAFTSNGLNCRKCFQGPCRINPFGDEPSQGVCGADRDQIVMETLFQATLEGVLESTRALALLGVVGTDQELPDLAPGLPAGIAERLSKTGLLPVRKADLLSVQNGFFSHKGYAAQTLRDLARMGLIHYGILCQTASSLAGLPGGAAVDPRGLNVLLVGQSPAGLLQALIQAGQRAGSRPINVFGQGAHRPHAVPAAADQGSMELLLGMNLDALVVAPNASWPGLEALAAKYGIPIVLADGGKSHAETAALVIDQASHHAQTAFYGTTARTIRPGAIGIGPVLDRAQELKQAFAASRIRGVVVLFGEAYVKETFFERTLACMEAALAEKALVLLGGDLGPQAEALYAELGRRKGAQLEAFAGALKQDGLPPVSVAGSLCELPRLVSLLGGLSGQGEGAVPTVVTFPEFFRTSTWAGAVSLLSLGFTVQIGARLPFWGSPSLTRLLQTEWGAITGGTLLAGPTLPEARVLAEEMVAALAARKAG